jgi:hypothetical protein
LLPKGLRGGRVTVYEYGGGGNPLSTTAGQRGRKIRLHSLVGDRERAFMKKMLGVLAGPASAKEEYPYSWDARGGFWRVLCGEGGLWAY